MKKIMIAICLVASAYFCASCKRVEVDLAGGTAIAKMAGFWDVTTADNSGTTSSRLLFTIPAVLSIQLTDGLRMMQKIREMP